MGNGPQKYADVAPAMNMPEQDVRVRRHLNEPRQLDSARDGVGDRGMRRRGGRGVKEFLIRRHY